MVTLLPYTRPREYITVGLACIAGRVLVELVMWSGDLENGPGKVKHVDVKVNHLFNGKSRRIPKELNELFVGREQAEGRN